MPGWKARERRVKNGQLRKELTVLLFSGGKILRPGLGSSIFFFDLVAQRHNEL